MTRHRGDASPLTLSATEWKLILNALGAYQHHAAYLDLHGKVTLLAEASGTASRGAASLAATASDANGVSSRDRRALTR